MEETSLKRTVDAGDSIEKMDAFTQSATAAANAVERLDKAWGSLAETLKTLNGSPHGGITFQMVSDVARAEIKPLKEPRSLAIAPENGPHRVFVDGVAVSHVVAVDPDMRYVLVSPVDGEQFSPVAFRGSVFKKIEGEVTLVAFMK